jgi:hypothetical protein
MKKYLEVLLMGIVLSSFTSFIIGIVASPEVTAGHLLPAILSVLVLEAIMLIEGDWDIKELPFLALGSIGGWLIYKTAVLLFVL